MLLCDEFVAESLVCIPPCNLYLWGWNPKCSQPIENKKEKSNMSSYILRLVGIHKKR